MRFKFASRWRLVGLFGVSSLGMCLGCSPPSPPSPPPHAESAVDFVPAGAESAPPPPVADSPVRWLDVAADKELKDAFGIFVEQRDQARAAYARQRWRFRAKVGDKLADFAVVRPEGLEQVSLHFRSAEEGAKANAQGEYLFEATVEDWLSRHLKDGIVVEGGGP